MKNIRHLSLTIALAILSIFLISSVAGATASANLTYLEMALPGGWYQYDYTASNTSTSGEKLWDIGLYYDEAVQGINFTWLNLPTGWTSDEPFWAGFEEATTNPTPATYTVLAGSSLPGFSFKTDSQIGSIYFDAYFITTTNGLAFSDGMTSGTSVPVVPEPISAILFLSGGATLAVRRLRKSQKV
ncbi:MAG: PEP-CTERM sorting domain-containing protein [Nitrospirae bacterium]|nr:PEP-CTERM sorting domain-containing protein [Nitrospirota bacterium]